MWVRAEGAFEAVVDAADFFVARGIFQERARRVSSEDMLAQFKRLGDRHVGRAGVPSVVIAGNHDNPTRVDAWGALAELAGARAVGKPRRAAGGGLVEIPTRAGETALVAALPFAPVRTWVTALELAGDETAAKARYAEMFQRAVQDLSGGFRPDAVNLLVAHTHLDGAVFGESERRVHLGDDWAAAPRRCRLPRSTSHWATSTSRSAMNLPTRVRGRPVVLNPKPCARMFMR
jgi:DNA repair exonuclease SbcCD nuclease subunit